MHIKHRRFRRARRHLTAALAHQPDHARYHYLLASALNSDERGDPRRAADHYQQSLAIDPQQPRCLGEYGLLALTLGQAEEGLDALRRARDLAPDDPDVVGNLVEGLRQEGLLDEARTVLRAAMFRNSRNERFRILRNDFEFTQLRREQETQRHPGLAGQAVGDGPVLLPFVQPPSGPTTTPAGRKTIRRDGAAPPTPPHLPCRDRRPNHRRAQ